MVIAAETGATQVDADATGAGGSDRSSPWPRGLSVAWWVLTALLPVLVLAGLTLWTLPDGFVDGSFHAPDVWALYLLIAGSACVLLRRRWPLATLAVAVAVAVASVGRGYSSTIPVFALFILPTVACRCDRIRVALGAALVLVELLALNAINSEQWSADVVSASVATAAFVAVGLVGRGLTWGVRRLQSRRRSRPAITSPYAVPLTWDPSVPPPGTTPPTGTTLPVVGATAAAGSAAPGPPPPPFRPDPDPVATETAASSPVPAARWWQAPRRHPVRTGAGVLGLVAVLLVAMTVLYPSRSSSSDVSAWGPRLRTESDDFDSSDTLPVAPDFDAQLAITSDRRGDVFSVGNSDNTLTALSAYDATGRRRWSHALEAASATFEDTGTDSLPLLAASPTGVVAVTTTGFDPNDETPTDETTDRKDQARIQVLDRSGRVIWRRAVTLTARQRVTGLAVTDQARVYLGLSTDPNDDEDDPDLGPGGGIVAGNSTGVVPAPASSSGTATPRASAAIRAIDRNGHGWTTVLADTGSDLQSPIVVTSAAGDVYAAGLVSRGDGANVTRIDSSGRERWHTAVPFGPSDLVEDHLAFDEHDQQIYLGLGVQSDDDFGDPFGTTLGDASDTYQETSVIHAALGPDGRIRWRHETTADNAVGGPVVALPGGGALWTGSEVPTIGPNYPNGFAQATFDRTDAQGRALGHAVYVQDGPVLPTSAAGLPDGAVVVAGISPTPAPEYDDGPPWRVHVRPLG